MRSRASWRGGVPPPGIISICVEDPEIKRTNPMRPIGFADDGRVNGRGSACFVARRTGRWPTGSPSRAAHLQRNPGRLQTRVLVEGVQRQIPAEAGLLESAERRLRAEGVDGVDRYRARP